MHISSPQRRLQYEPSGSTVLGQSALTPVQRSAGLHGPTAAAHTVPPGWNVSGQSGLEPVQKSGASHGPVSEPSHITDEDA
jgi:hypothetical protein